MDKVVKALIRIEEARKLESRSTKTIDYPFEKLMVVHNGESITVKICTTAVAE